MLIEGIQYEIDWRKFKKGTSITFPCLDAEKAEAEVRSVTGRMKLKVIMKVVYDDGIKALRVWKV